MAARANQPPVEDLWDKDDRRRRNAIKAAPPSLLLASKSRSGKRRVATPKAVKIMLDNCIVCDKPVPGDIWSRPAVFLGKRMSWLARSRHRVVVHDECVAEGARIAGEQGYSWSVEDRRG